MQLDAGRAAVTGAIAPLNDFNLWVRDSFLVIVLLVLGAILLTRLAGWVRDKIMAHIDARATETDELVRSEGAKHRQVVAQVVTWSALAVIYVVTAVRIVQELGVPLAGLVAPAALLSAALGFGLQRFVQDIGAGFFITGERQYGFGDVVTIATAGVTQPVTGTVEDVTLRVTRLRTVSGEVITTPNGQIIQVTNLSRDWARAVIDVPVPAAVDVSHVTDILRQVGEEAYSDDRLRKMMLDPPTVMSTRSRCAWWRGRSRAFSSRSAASSGRGSPRPSAVKASSSPPSSTPAAPPGAPHELQGQAPPHVDPGADRAVHRRVCPLPVGARTPGHGIARAGPQPNGDAPARTNANPHPHAAAYEPFAHAVADQPVTVPDAVRAGRLAVDGIAASERAGISRAVGDVGPAVRPAG
jgi:small conductance mechanosensitive channel